jgi:endonuclease YncB( thermonuclease family)
MRVFLAVGTLALLAGATGFADIITGGTPVATSAASGAFSCTVASITDGDTLRCAERGPDGRAIRVRLSGIDARERDGSCAVGHPCASSSAESATAELHRLASGRVLSCQPDGSTYGRIAAFCRAGGVDLSCAMLDSGTVAKWDRYWRDHYCS